MRKSAIGTVRELAGEKWKDSMKDMMVDPGRVETMVRIVEKPGEVIDGLIGETVPDGLTMWEFEQRMMQEKLALDASGADSEQQMLLIEKYAKFAHSTFDADRGEFRIVPLNDFAPAYDRVEQRVEEYLKIGAVSVQADSEGVPRVFIQQNLSGFQCALLLLGIQLRLDVRSQEVQIGLPDGDWVALNDLRESLLRCVIEERFFFQKKVKEDWVPVPAEFQSLRWRKAKEAHLAGNVVDCFGEWLERLPMWDEVPRLDTWMMDAGLVFETGTDEKLLRWVCSSILLVACHRVFEPGYKHDVMPVLIGPQGAGKSTALSWLMPKDERRRWFKDELRLSADSKERVEAILGSVIVEVAEMTGATSADIESLKAFLSRQTDNVRLAYRANAESLPRMCSMAGTANRPMLPNDPTGNRRFAAAFLVAGNPDKVRSYLDENRVQLWAEAYARAKDGEKTWLDGALANAQREVNEGARSSDMLLEQAVEKWLDSAFVRTAQEQWFHISKAAFGCGMVGSEDDAARLSVRDGQRLGRALQAVGCQSKRKYVAGKQQRVWVVPACGDTM